jgi:tRNA threonylcarbamoyladenosine biosynthesis protein TsaB
MSLLLQIDTAGETAFVALAKNGKIMHVLYNETQKEHANFLQAGIEQLMNHCGTTLNQIDAVAVTAGPGSYTGLRVGIASAKGLCYALKIPLISIGSLELLTVSAMQVNESQKTNLLYCPMIDARRMEVFTAIYNSNLEIIQQPKALILNESSFEKELSNEKILFFGSGSDKWMRICKHEHALFESVVNSPESMCAISYKYYFQKIFTDLVYSEPFYLKDFQTVINT